MDSTSQIEKYKLFKASKDNLRKTIYQRYTILGYIAAGTYGRVYKAESKVKNSNNNEKVKEFAIKKFKPDKEGEGNLSTGLSQSACREISLCIELKNENVVHLEEVLLGPSDRSIYMVFEYAEHDLLQILLHHSQMGHGFPIPDFSIKSFLWQLLNGVSYLHLNWVLHRDLKPANILVTSDGVVKIADLGLARLFHKPLQPLYNGDKLIVTIWYRSIELLLGTRHYTKAIEERWPNLEYMPDYKELQAMPNQNYPYGLHEFIYKRFSSKNSSLIDLISLMFEYDPVKRITAEDALKHQYFLEDPKPSMNAFCQFDTKTFNYPMRTMQQDVDEKSGGMTSNIGNDNKRIKLK
ncbi:cyclin-dependent protein kinase [Clydaea vesicula]|uniref:Cyclin-dependent kinase 8 n=1 Tax=Clydaea vesicula TaxID=447962 RepID=A0AAD5Y0A1_9FUNG|nr:cyclin-dependent protein kinase [Clydaea vesicula]